MQHVCLFIPHFHGYDSPLQDFISWFGLPKELRFITNISGYDSPLQDFISWFGLPKELRFITNISASHKLLP